MQATLTINGQTVSLEGTAAELAEAIARQTLVVPKEDRVRKQPKAAPKARKARKAGTRTAPKEPTFLTKGSRAAFAKAYLKAFGEPDPELAKEIGAKGTVLHWGTKSLATLAVTTNQVPQGYQIGAGYRQLVTPKQAPKGRVRNAKGQFVKAS